MGYYYSLDDPTPDNWTTNEYSHSFYGVSEGTHTFYVMSQDDQGATSYVASRTFTYIPSGPTVLFEDDAENGMENWMVYYSAAGWADEGMEVWNASTTTEVYSSPSHSFKMYMKSGSVQQGIVAGGYVDMYFYSVQLPASGTLTLSFYVASGTSVDAPAGTEIDSGGSVTALMGSRMVWQEDLDTGDLGHVTVDVTRYAGQLMNLRFTISGHLEVMDGDTAVFEAWAYIDDIVVKQE